MEILLDSTVMIAKDVISCDLVDEIAMLNLKDGVYYGLDPVGARIWNLIQKPTKVRTVLEAILYEYDVDEKQCKSDLMELLQELLEKGLVNIE